MESSVKFPTSLGLQLAATVFAPAYRAEERLPAVVVSHPASGVKEQTASEYARRLAEAGFLAVAFDCAFQGESEGFPRGLENPSQRVEDIKAAVSYLTTRDDVSSEKIGLLGICASGGYAVSAAASDLRVKAVATISGADIARQFRCGADGTQDPVVFQSMLNASAEARSAAAHDGSVRTFPIFPPSESEARAMGQHAFEGWEYYCTPRGQHPRSMKEMAFLSVDEIATFDAYRFIKDIAPRPLLFVLGTEAVTKWIGSEAFANAKDPKELVWIDGASHVDLYDKPEFVGVAAEKLNTFFHQSLR